MRINNLLALAALGLPLLITSCVSTTSGSQRVANPGKWLEPSPTLRADIEAQAARLPFTHNSERVELVRWFAGVGEPAYPWLFELAQDEREGVASAAISALGSTGDQRLIEDIRALPWPTASENLSQALERARALLRLGDWSAIPTMIVGLESDRPYTRALCARALTDATNNSHGFQPHADEASRANAVKEWKDWWRSRSNDPLLEASSVR